jgi:hypothetical protein
LEINHKGLNHWRTPKRVKIQTECDFKYQNVDDSTIPFPKNHVFRDNGVPKSTAYCMLADTGPCTLGNSDHRTETCGKTAIITAAILDRAEQLLQQENIKDAYK